jgi:hypothetical protein
VKVDFNRRMAGAAMICHHCRAGLCLKFDPEEPAKCPQTRLPAQIKPGNNRSQATEGDGGGGFLNEPDEGCRRLAGCVDGRIDAGDERKQEYDRVRNDLWSASGMDPAGGMRCLGCLEQPLGRRLMRDDFILRAPVNRNPLAPRLRDRLGLPPLTGRLGEALS